MLRLITLGGLALTRDGAPYAGAAAQRRRLAILAVLAASGTAGVSRDKLLAYFWPESGEDQARHALNQALFQLRQALGPDSITSAGTTLALNRAAVTSDIVDFEQAAADRALKQAEALYQGPFLDGFRLPDAPDFERWVTATRARLARMWDAIHHSLTAAAARREPPTGESRLRARIEEVSNGRYAYERTLAKGAVLTTLAVTEVHQGVSVALHVVSSQAMAQAHPDHFVRILRRVGAIGDRRVLPVLDAMVTEDFTYFVTPPSAGPTLRDRLARDRELTVPDAIELARELADILAVAHQHGVRHGDLRPKHIGLSTDHVVVSGWSLIDALAPVGEAGGALHVPETAVTIAAPAYASPEQLAGSRLPDASSDMYSLGCVIFEALAGAPPFAPTRGHAILERKLTESAPSVRDARASVPEDLDAVLRTCLARSPADRYASSAALVDALAQLS
ncbi:MAG TPA: protein kinase [Gemmatimonadaceae bacterium]|nr:protein kinase [Gemmatimonadaceae bacterium]